MHTFSDKYKAFFEDFGKGKAMVLSTSENNIVSSRMMSVVAIDGGFYFQTDITFRKYRQLSSNPNVALCTDNVQIEGICVELGHPLDNAAFCERFRESFKGSYDAYTSLKNERLFCVTPLYIERWVYIDSVPYIETFYIKDKLYKCSKYCGV